MDWRVLIALAALCYAADFVWFEYRMRNAKSNDPLQTLTFYYATAMKNGKVEVFYDQPQTQTCVHSLFSHGGYPPCWRFSRSGIQRVSAIIPSPSEAFFAQAWPPAPEQISERSFGQKSPSG